MNNHYKTHLSVNDLPENYVLNGDIAIDTEAMGLKISRDRLCLVQICDEEGNSYLVHYPQSSYNYNDGHRLKLLLQDNSRQKIFHYGRFDVAILKHYLDIEKITNIFCTKIASRLTRTYTDHHGLKNLVGELLRVDLRKEYQSSNWGADEINEGQKQYAISDVIFLHRLRKKLIPMLENYGRLELCNNYCNFLDIVTDSDLTGFEEDLFRHS